MRRTFLLIAAILGCQYCFGAPGDTTWVQANNTNLTYYGLYDTTITFPSSATTYRRIYMIFTLGKYSCPGYTYGTGSVPWCGDWDYTVLNYLMTPGGDTMELGRLITPYANSAAPRTPLTWTQRYVYDVTDYASKLQGSATMRILFSGYSGGFTGNIKFAFIEGTPDRNVLAIKKLWNGSYNYGDTSHSDSFNINTHFTATTQTAPVGTQSAVMKFTVTGHGSDANYCNEFCSHNYQVMVNGSAVATKTIWRDNCGLNELYPQSGTWVYNRANWCPGAIVNSDYSTLTGVTSGATYNTGIVFDNYVSTGGASYTTDGTIIYYGAMNKTLDASIEDIVTPTNNENRWRENPVCGNPTVHVKNTGSTTITAMNFSYGVRGYAHNTYNWAGSLPALAETDITLPGTTDLENISGTTGNYIFDAKVTSVNSATDADPTNDSISSTFVAAPVWPMTFKVQMITNNEAISATSTTSETSWVIYDMANNIVASRTNANITRTYTDTVRLGPGCYKFVIYDSSCNGLYWWANPSGTTQGSLFVKKLDGTNITMHGYNYSGSYRHDFGCGFTQYFYTNFPTGVKEISNKDASITVYPNPANEQISIDLDGLTQVDGWLTLLDMTGREVYRIHSQSIHNEISTGTLPNGLYTIKFTETNNADQTIVNRFIIAK